MPGRPDERAMLEKRASLIAEVEKLLDPKDAHLASRVVEAFCDITPPTDPPIVLYQITLKSGGLHGGESRKPGNMRFNWKKLNRELADMVMNSVGAVAVPFLIPFAALSIWNKFWTHATIPLSREQATTLFAMWSRKDKDHRIDGDKALKETNELLAVFHLPLLDQAEFDVILRDLVVLKCVEMDEGQIWLREWVQTGYM